MNKKILKIIDVIISLIGMIYFLKDLSLFGDVANFWIIVELFLYFPIFIIFSMSIITMIISICIKEDKKFFVISQILKITFYLLFVLIEKFLLEQMIKFDLLTIIPIIGIIELLILMLTKKSIKEKNI